MLLLATDTPFWQARDPGEQRVAAILESLRAHFPELSVYFADALDMDARDAINGAFPGLSVHDLPEPIKIRRMRRNRLRAIARRLGARTPPGPLMREQREDFARLCGRVQPRVILCTAPRLADLIAGLPVPRPKAWADCHGCWALGNPQALHEVADASLEHRQLNQFDGLIAPSAGDAALLERTYRGKAIIVAGSEADAMADLIAALEDAR